MVEILEMQLIVLGKKYISCTFFKVLQFMGFLANDWFFSFFRNCLLSKCFLFLVLIPNFNFNLNFYSMAKTLFGHMIIALDGVTVSQYLRGLSYQNQEIQLL